MIKAGSWWFNRLEDGSVHVRKTAGSWWDQMEVEATFTAEEWGKVASAMLPPLPAPAPKVEPVPVPPPEPEPVVVPFNPDTMTATVTADVVVSSARKPRRK